MKKLIIGVTMLASLLSFAGNSVPTAHTVEKEDAILAYMFNELGVEGINSMELIGTNVKLKAWQFYANILQLSENEKLNIGGVPQNIYNVKFMSEDSKTCAVKVTVNLENYNTVGGVESAKKVLCY